MWRNTVVEEFIEWLREHNKHTSNKCGVFGIDIYSFETSKQAVLDFINANYPHLFEKCRNAYKFNEYRRSAERLADDVLQELLTISKEGPISEELFAAISNARVVVSSAKYSVDHSWNTRDTHFFEALQHATTRYNSKAVVWAHSSHISNANYTGMKDMGELNIGSLVKQHYGDQSAAIGFSTYKGTVTCTTHWDEPAQRKNVNPGISGSLELLLHQASERMEQKNYALYLSDHLKGNLIAEKQVIDLLGRNLFHRYIGVVYRPRTERYSHYIDTKTAKAFDIMIHVDESEAVVPLDMTREWSSFQ
jgi:erythromycin esterase-like protein